MRNWWLTIKKMYEKRSLLFLWSNPKAALINWVNPKKRSFSVIVPSTDLSKLFEKLTRF
jgi:hypothetical protein